MLTPLQATEYADHLHPAFAGYLYDGVVSETDALASIFYFIKKGYVEPEFRDNNITRGIAFLRQTGKRPVHLFERAILAALFVNGSRVAATEVGVIVKNGLIQRALESAVTDNPKLLVTPPEPHPLPQKHESRHLVNDPDQVIHRVVTRPKMSVIVVILGVAALLLVALRQGDRWEDVYYVGLALSLAYLIKRFGYSTRHVYHHGIPENVKRHYDELLEFLTRFPPQPHAFTYEYIPYAIAFGLDTSWHRDFGLTPAPSVKHR